MSNADAVLKLVTEALEDFDNRPLAVTVRRAVRIANLLGESQTAIRFGLELQVTGGDRQANAENHKRLLADRSTWGTADGPAEAALSEFLEDRRVDDGRVQAMSVAEQEFLESLVTDSAMTNTSMLEERMRTRQMMERVRNRVFTALCSWERQLSLGSSAAFTFGTFERRVQRLLSEGAPALVDQFNAVSRRLQDALSSDHANGGAEELAQAVTTCRRILKAVTDHVFPGQSGLTSADGHILDNEKYRNRIREFVKVAGASDRMRGVLEASVRGLCDRFDALDALASKGVHADIAIEEAELCAITTYIVAGEILRLHELTGESETKARL